MNKGRLTVTNNVGEDYLQSISKNFCNHLVEGTNLADWLKLGDFISFFLLRNKANIGFVHVPINSTIIKKFLEHFEQVVLQGVLGFFL